MTHKLYSPKMLLFGAVLGLFSCSDDETPSLRAKIDYNILTPETPYSQLFVDVNGSSTVDLTTGNQRHKMFQALNYYSTSSVSAKTEISANKLKNLFANTGSAFTDISTSTISVNGNELNNSGIQLRDRVASSLTATDADAVRVKMESHFDAIAKASKSIANTASKGNAGMLGTYLVDGDGIEIAQVIQKSLIGALQLDYIGNVLLNEGLKADNFKTVGDKNYTQLEHNWDEAYGLLTLNQVYLLGATDANRSTVEFGAGAYVWEYNKANYANIFPAFLKGRTAIVNNDKAEYETQALFIRTQIEKAIAAAAVGYLEKWKNGATDAARAHAIGEGIGFIYSLRFATIHQADAQFSDEILNSVIGSEFGFWDIEAAKVNSAVTTIKTKFNL